jgi:hypothetical protein
MQAWPGSRQSPSAGQAVVARQRPPAQTEPAAQGEPGTQAGEQKQFFAPPLQAQIGMSAGQVEQGKPLAQVSREQVGWGGKVQSPVSQSNPVGQRARAEQALGVHTP